MEIFKDIIGYEDRYKISNYGNVISKELIKFNKKTPYTKKEHILKPYISNNGYKIVNLVKNKKVKKILVHRLVAIHFIENSNAEFNVINHIDNNRLNNHFSNLEWCNLSLNQQHRYKTNYTHSKNKQSKYTGVSKNRNKWRARININGKQIHIGTFLTELEAKYAYDSFKI